MMEGEEVRTELEEGEGGYLRFGALEGLEIWKWRRGELLQAVEAGTRNNERLKE